MAEPETTPGRKDKPPGGGDLAAAPPGAAAPLGRRLSRSLVRLILLGGALCGGCRYTVEEHDLFYPRRVSLEHWSNQKPTDGVRIRPIERTDGPTLRGWLFTPPQVSRYMVHFYGNGEFAAAAPVARRLIYLARRLQCEILVMDYRGYGFTPGRPTFDNIQSDGLWAYEYMVARAGGRGVLVYGLSIGTVPAVHVAAERRAAGLILQAPPTAAAEIVPGFGQLIPIPLRWFIRVRPSQELIDLHPQPVETIRRVRCPLLVIHGLDDKIVPPRFGRRMWAQAGSKSKRWLEVPGAGHNDLSLTDERTIRALEEFATSCDR